MFCSMGCDETEVPPAVVRVLRDEDAAVDGGFSDMAAEICAARSGRLLAGSTEARGGREARTWHLCELASSPAAGTSTIFCGRNRHVTADLARRYVISRSGYIIWPREHAASAFLFDFCLDLLPSVLGGSCAATLLLDSDLCSEARTRLLQSRALLWSRQRST